MKRLAFSLAALLSVAHGADGPFEATLRAEFERLAADLGVKAKLVIDPQGKDTRAEPDGTVVLGLVPLNGLAPAARLTSARFYLAHELWHQRQYQLYGYEAVKATPEVQRLHECQADLMGAEQLIRTGEDDLSPKQLQTVMDLAYSIGVPVHLQVEHPAPEQRRTAVKYGFTFGATNARFFPMWQKELGDRAHESISGLRSQIGYQDGVGVEAWSLQQCKMVTHYTAEALSGIATDRAVVRFNKDPNAPFVYYNVPYRNISSRPIRLTVAIQSTMVSRKDPKDLGKRISFALQQYLVDIAPGATFEAAGTLPWYGDKEDYYPVLEYRTDGARSLVAAEFVGGETEGLTCLGASLEGKTQLAKDLGKVLTKLAPTADTGFKPFRAGAATTLSDSVYYKSTLQLPEATETEIELEQEGAARVTATLYTGKDEQQALRAYERYRDAILEMCPVGIKYKESTHKYGPDLTLSFSRKTQVNVYVYGSPEKGTYRAYFRLNATKWQ